MKRRRPRLGLDLIEERILARWLIEMRVDDEAGVQDCQARTPMVRGPLSGI